MLRISVLSQVNEVHSLISNRISNWHLAAFGYFWYHLDSGLEAEESVRHSPSFLLIIY